MQKLVFFYFFSIQGWHTTELGRRSNSEDDGVATDDEEGDGGYPICTRPLSTCSKTSMKELLDKGTKH